MLRTGRCTVRLNSFDCGSGNFACQIRVLAVIFKISAAKRIAMNVHSGSKQNVGAFSEHLIGNSRIDFFDKLRIE